MPRIPIYTAEDSELILDTVRKIIASGWVIPAPGGGAALPSAGGGPQFYNASGETIPAYAIMQITGTQEYGGQTYYEVGKYDEDERGGFLFNGPRDVADKDLGTAQSGEYLQALGDGTAVTCGHLWGPVAGEWDITDNGGPFVAIGDDEAADNVIRVRRDTDVHTGVVTTEISAFSGTTFGSGVVTLETVGASKAKTAAQTGITVLTRMTEATAVDAVVILDRTDNGRLIMVSEDCSA